MTIGIRTKPVPYCPDCGAQMVLRMNRQTKEKFWGCSTYPECRGTRNIMPDGQPEDDEPDRDTYPGDWYHYI